jgi:hypothetical protein
MRSMNSGRRVYVCGALLAALVILVAPMSAAAGDSPTVRITQPAVGRVVLDVADAKVAVRKEITADQSIVSMTTGKERVSITIRRGVLTLSGPDGTVSVGGGAGLDSTRLVAMLQRSDAVSRARQLLGTITNGPGTFAGQSMLLTRAILEMGNGTTNALDQHQEWVSQRAVERAAPGRAHSRPMLVRVSYLEPQKMGPGDCWDAYHKEAIRIADDFGECTDGLAWYEAHKWAGCSLVYAVRSEAAMAWFISCNGGVPFNA